MTLFMFCRVCADVIAGVVTKCLNARPKTKGKGIALCLAYIEAEQSATTVVSDSMGDKIEVVSFLLV